MVIMEIVQCSFEEFEKMEGTDGVANEYSKEAGLPGFPLPVPHLQTYRALDQAGAIRVFVAVDDGGVIGFAIVLCSILPHYSVRVAHLESFFVSPDKRKTGAAMALYVAARQSAIGCGAVGLMASAMVGSAMNKFIRSKKKCSMTHEVFTEVF